MLLQIVCPGSDLAFAGPFLDIKPVTDRPARQRAKPRRDVPLCALVPHPVDAARRATYGSPVPLFVAPHPDMHPGAVFVGGADDAFNDGEGARVRVFCAQIIVITLPDLEPLVIDAEEQDFKAALPRMLQIGQRPAFGIVFPLQQRIAIGVVVRVAAGAEIFFIHEHVKQIGLRVALMILNDKFAALCAQKAFNLRI